MRLKEIYNSDEPVISFEIFPPKGEGEEVNEKIKILFDELKKLCVYNPAFVSVTYGAGGSTQERSFDLVLKIKNELKKTPMPHFTCVGSTKQEILKYIKLIENAGIENILALRGDPPKGETEFVKPKDGFGYANELVEFIKNNSNLCIAVAGYPEGHFEAESFEDDLINLKRKVDAGADIIITQLFYDNNYFYNFVEKISKMGINIPVIPGVLPITSLSQIKKITSLCHSNIPEKLSQLLKKYENNPESMKKAGIEYSYEQCQDLITNKVKGIQFYTLNNSKASSEILKSLKNMTEISLLK